MHRFIVLLHATAKAWTSLFNKRDQGQALILFAGVFSALVAVTGGAVEGGRVLVEYRQMQSAADMAALIGAQRLPCGTADTSCQQAAQTDVCHYAYTNGFGGDWDSSASACRAGTDSTVTASVPPNSCSPYDFLSYGNSGNTSCKAAAAPPFYDYVEAQLTKNLGFIPIFDIPVTISAHSVAKHGIGTPADYTLMSLSPTTPMNMQGSNTTIVDGSAFGNGGVSGNSYSEACGGGWFSAGTVTGVTTNNSGTPQYAPAGCGTGTDGTPVTQGGLPQISDPYAGTAAPPTQGSSFPNCTPCTQGGWWYDGSQWYQGGIPTVSSGGSIELFPGIYTRLSLGNTQHYYFNPGVYTITNGVTNNHGYMCVYGAPTCDSTTCNSTNFTTGTPQANAWLYSCSTWGYWDDSSLPGRPSILSTAPTWYDSSSSSITSVPLNGITFYFPPGAGGWQEVGNGGKQGGGNQSAEYLSAPNPCPGTGTFSTGSVSFPQGAPLTGSQGFDFTGSFMLLSPHVAPSPSPQVYPSMDLSLLGECTVSSRYVEWPGEMVKPQHLHFLFYMDPNGTPSGGNGSFFSGASGQDLYGIFYAPNDSITLRGAGKSAGGPPWVTGQIVANTVDFSGSSYSDLTYRPCGPGSVACGSGAGTQLVE